MSSFVKAREFGPHGPLTFMLSEALLQHCCFAHRNVFMRMWLASHDEDLEDYASPLPNEEFVPKILGLIIIFQEF